MSTELAQASSLLLYLYEAENQPTTLFTENIYYYYIVLVHQYSAVQSRYPAIGRQTEYTIYIHMPPDTNS